MSIAHEKQRVISVVSILALLGALTLGLIQFEANQHASAIPPRHPQPTLHIISNTVTPDMWSRH